LGIKLTDGQGFESVSLSLGVNMKLLDIGVQAQEPVTADQLASGSEADTALVGRYTPMVQYIVDYANFPSPHHEDASGHESLQRS
jgi:hypothetical protein